jgi:Cytochrome C oxidase subunit II, periplasmic domain
VCYVSDDPSLIFETANEIHIPVGQPVRLKLASPDVIHSFWVPALTGKTDLIPGQTNVTWLQADEPGVYWGHAPNTAAGSTRTWRCACSRIRPKSSKRGGTSNSKQRSPLRRRLRGPARSS